MRFTFASNLKKVKAMRKIDVNSLENRYFRMHIGTDAYPYKVLAAYVDDDNNLKRCVVQGMFYSADPTKECHEGHQNWDFQDNPDTLFLQRHAVQLVQ